MDADLQSVQEARALVARAATAQRQFASADQASVDAVVRAMSAAAASNAERLARVAVDETGMGVYEHKIIKNRFASEFLLEYILPLRTVGVLREDRARKVRELAVPMGVVGAIIPTTNPTSTAIYKALISVKARNAVVMSPHPRATRSVVETARLLDDAAVRAGAPPGLVNAMTVATIEGTTALMRHDLTAVILATGGAEMVRAVYAAGKPAYGVGPGNVPSIIERTANIEKAVADIVDGKTFDAGVLCSAENAVICDAPIERPVREAFRRERAHFCSPEEKRALERVMIPPTGRGINPDVVGKQPQAIARRAGFAIAPDAKLMIVDLSAVGRDDPLSREKLCPVLGFFVEDGWERCCERAIELLKYGGLGHSLGIHSRSHDVIDRFFAEKPAFRIIVNSNVAIGAIGYTTGFAPAMTLGPGSWGGSITSDNITPLHLINIKRLGEEIRPYIDPLRKVAAGPATSSPAPASSDTRRDRTHAERTPAERTYGELAPGDVQRIVHEFLADFRAARR
ncbi:MAG TPA: aldehyde dehydrogenase family protein [Gemmatimonadaceae bacterium]|nr:aldehyde dehydrogenase family protein [Gemmatimonadaceae bacterium]